MKKLLLVFMALVVVQGVWGVKITKNGNSLTVDYTQDTGVDFQTASNGISEKNNITDITVKGEVTSSNDLNNLCDWYCQNSMVLLNLGDATISIDVLKSATIKNVQKLRLPDGTALPDPISDYVGKRDSGNAGNVQNQLKWNCTGRLLYVYSITTDASGKKTANVAVGAQQNNGDNNKKILANAISNGDFNDVDYINIVSSGNETQADKDAVTNAGKTPSVESSYDNATKTLTLGSDYSDDISAIMTKLSVEKSHVSKVVFPDGSEWTPNTLSAQTANTTTNDAMKAALEKAGFTVDNVIASMGSYISVVNGVTTLTLPNGETFSTAWSKMTADEQQAFKNATNLKLKGTYHSDDFIQMKGNNSKVETLDLSDAMLDQGTVTYTYYYLDENAGQRYPLQNDGAGYYYNKDGQIINVQDKDVRIYEAKVSGGVSMPSEWKTSLTSISLPTSSDYKVVGADFCNGFTSLTSVTIPDNIEVIGNNAFYSCASLTNVTIPEGVKAICTYAFYKTGLTTVTIPGSVEFIGTYAFGECTSMASLIFAKSDDDHHMYIQISAFNMNGGSRTLTDIYINTDAKIDCANEAFNRDITFGQSQAGSVMCTLHFSSEVAEHYANLSHPLTIQIAQDAGKFQKWLVDHLHYASEPKSNGWWEFVNTGTNDDDDKPILTGKFLRTWSDYNYDRIVPRGVKAYIVVNLQKSGNDFKLSLKQLNVIPKRTGVILYGVPNSKNQNGQPVLSMSLCEVGNGLPLRRDYWYALTDADATDYKNYLWPTVVSLDADNWADDVFKHYKDLKEDASGKLTYTEIEYIHQKVRGPQEGKMPVNPWDDNPSKFTTPNGAPDGYDATVLNGFFRNFFMSRYGSTKSGKAYKAENNGVIESNFVGFFRALPSSISTGMAFLRMKSDEYDYPEGGEAIIIGDTETYSGQSFKNYQVEYDPSNGNIQNPETSGYWYDYVNYKDATNKKENMNWTDETNWGDRDKVVNKTTGGAKFIPLKFTGEPEITENGDGTATMIISASMMENEENASYYTLQGVKVLHPTKGIYIRNGKKVVIK